MAGRTVVVNGHYRVLVFLAKGTYHIVGTFLHFCVGTLYGIQFDTATVTACIYRRYRAATQSDTVIVSTDYDYFIAGFGLSFQAVALCAVAYTACQHDYFVVAVYFIVFLVFESQYRTADKRLSELVSEVTGTVGGFDQDLFWGLIQPFTYRQDFFP